MTDPHDCERGTGCGDIAVVVPEGKQPIDLKMSELDIASRKIGTDVGIAADVHKGEDGKPYASPKRYKALMLLTWLWARRTDPKFPFETVEDYDLDQLNHALGYHRPTPDDDGEEPDAEDPSGPSVDGSGSS